MLKKLMQPKNLKYLLVIATAAVAFVGFKNFTGDRDKEVVVFSMVQDALMNLHLQPRVINDDFSEEVFAQFLEEVDYNKLLLTAEEVAQLEVYQHSLDDAFEQHSTAFFETAYALLQNGIQRSRNMYRTILANPVNLEGDRTLNSNPENRPYASNELELQQYWEDQLTWRILNKMYNKQRAQEEDAATDSTVVVKTLEELEADARAKELEQQEDWFDNINDIARIEWFAMFMNAYCMSFDPHTNYQAPREQENFEMSMTGQFEGIGAQLKKEGDYIVIERIIAGSACWRQGDLEAGDKILFVAQGEGEPLDIVGWKVEEAIEHIRGEKGTEVRLTVKKKDGTRQVIPIIRDVVELESTFARSAMFDGSIYSKQNGEWETTETVGEKIGYINLPKFYVDFYDESNRNAAEDVKNELVRLKDQGMTGLILDLRNNGGGSLPAAIEIAGLFSEKGPVVQIKSYKEGTSAKSNRDGRIYWNGPMIVLVNQYSASASEIVAAALQDRNRALIVGPAPSTFGKGTVQNMLGFDNFLRPNMNDLKPLGALKVTTDKFYRISGGTTQQQGVVPDITLPGAYDQIAYGEKEYEHSLDVDFIPTANYYIHHEWDAKFNKAKRQSAKRVEQSEAFNKFKEYALWIAESDKDMDIPLNYEAFKSLQDAMRIKGESFEKLGRVNDSLGVQSLPWQQVVFERDSTDEAIYRRWFKALSHDLVLHESAHIMSALTK